MTENEPPPTQMTCPRCGSARSRAATFCGTCGQDLRPGAPVTPPSPTPPTAPPGIAAAPPVRLPGSQAPLPREQPTPKPAPAVVPKEDTSLSFSERYRGTEYSNPDIERFLPPTPAARRRRRWARILLVAVLFVALLAAALGGSWFLFFSPDALIGPTASPSAAAASATPRPTPTPRPTIHGLIADEVEVAACLLFAEDAQRAGDLATLRADALAGGTADLAARAAALTSAIETSRSSLPTLEADAATQALAAAWSALYEIETDALAQVAAAPADADALKAAVKRLDEAKEARAAVVEAHAALVATYPEATCVVVP